MADIGKAERDDMRRHARGVISEPNYRVDIPKLLDALEAAEKERDALRRHYDAAAGEHNLLELLDKYEEDRCSALIQLQAAQAALEAVEAEAERMREAAQVAEADAQRLTAEMARLQPTKAWRALPVARREKLLSFLRDEVTQERRMAAEHAKDMRRALDEGRPLAVRNAAEMSTFAEEWAEENEAALQALEALAGEVSGG